MELAKTSTVELLNRTHGVLCAVFEAVLKGCTAEEWDDLTDILTAHIDEAERRALRRTDEAG